MRSLVIASLLFVAACGAQLGDGGQSSPDASGGGGGGGGGGAGGGIDAAIDAPVIAACSNRVVFLNFDGVTLTQGVSDATQNRAAWLEAASSTAPPYRLGQANRAADIAAITNGVRTQLAGIGVMVTTTRPTTGQYVMIAFGGNNTTNVATRFGGAVNRLDCGDVQRNDVAWISDGVTPTQRVVNFAVGAIGFGLGLTGTTVTTDCMCGWDNICTANNTVACTLTEGIPRDPAANQLCPGLTTQSETSAFTQAFCQ